jgi:nucleotide sugar dehydrogenase
MDNEFSLSMQEVMGKFPKSDCPIVCIQGLGFVGTAMAIAVANALDENKEPFFNVIGVDLPTEIGLHKIDAINQGNLPIESTDIKLEQYFNDAYERGNLVATSDPEVYSQASIVLVDVHLDVIEVNGNYDFDLSGFTKAINTLGLYIKPDCLVVVETTVPPGVCEKVVAPELKACFKERGLSANDILLAHSYERVMPGVNYLDSIINFWRVYSGYNEASASRCEEFLSKVINTEKFPLTRLHSTTASETAKVLENSYRATNIAFIEEWGRFAEKVGVDLFAVLSAIRMRPTHNNIGQPGFGVGGYCLTKDPLFAKIAAEKLFNVKGLDFPFSTAAIATNKAMPLVTIDKLIDIFQGKISGKKILLLGVSYRQDVSDTRFSPSEIFVESVKEKGAHVICHDPLVENWIEMDIAVESNIPSPVGLDAVVIALPHAEYLTMDFIEWLGDSKPIIMDSSNVLTDEKRALLRSKNLSVYSIGRGEGL